MAKGLVTACKLTALKKYKATSHRMKGNWRWVNKPWRIYQCVQLYLATNKWKSWPAETVRFYTDPNYRGSVYFGGVLGRFNFNIYDREAI